MFIELSADSNTELIFMTKFCDKAFEQFSVISDKKNFVNFVELKRLETYKEKIKIFYKDKSYTL